MCITRKSSFLWPGVAIREAGMMDSMHVTERFAYCRKNRLCKFNTLCKNDRPNRLSRLNAYRRYRAKPLNGSPAGLNHPSKLVAMLEANWCWPLSLIMSQSIITRLESQRYSFPLFALFWWLQERRESPQRDTSIFSGLVSLWV